MIKMFAIIIVNSQGFFDRKEPANPNPSQKA